ncbi:MAG: double-strand break repair helicase AddA, partial [Caulobacterales bacterium]|nr:double-strand break repair helicase AddA [Caulobacterales bacterium]
MTPLEAAVAAQRLAADPSVHVGVTANAGSGKTRVLVDRVIRVLLTGAPPERILCVTYTKAAASEMQSRLFERLGAWSTADDDSLAGELAALDPDAPAGARMEEARTLFAKALETPGGLKVQTIHAFCERLLRRFPLEAGIVPGFEVLDDVLAARLARRARAALARQALDGEGELRAAYAVLAARLDDEAQDGFLTWAADKRAALSRWLDREGAQAAAARIAARLDVPADAAGETMREAAWGEGPLEDIRAAAALFAQGSANDQKQAGRIAAALDASAPDAAFDAYADVIFTCDGKVRADLVTKTLGEAQPLLASLYGGTKLGAYGSEVARMEAARDLVRRAEIAALSRAGLALAGGFITAYEAEKRRLGALDFADLIAAAGRLLSASDAAQWVLSKLDGGIDHVLVDEAQDTAPDQWDVIDALTDEFFAGAGAREVERTVFLVGDEKQSIYSFQGAEPRRFLAESQRLAQLAPERYRGPQLSVSFRSAPAILAAVDAVLDCAPVLDAPPPEGDRPAHIAARQAEDGDVEGLVELWPLVPAPDAPAAPEPWSAPVDAGPPDTARHRLARLVADTVKGWLEAGEAVSERREGRRVSRAMRPGDVMILVRRRGALFDLLIRRLKAVGVPVAGADRLTLSAELAVEDVLGAARAALLPEDDLAVAEFLKSPFLHPAADEAPPIDEEALFDLAHGREGHLIDALAASADTRFAEADAVLARLRDGASQLAPYDLLARFLASPSATGESYARRLFARLGEEAEDPVRELLARALAHERRGAPSLERFVHDTLSQAGQIKREMTETGDAVRVMTAHGAKGLEAPVVILPDAADPAEGRADVGAFLDEEGGLIWSPHKKRDPAVAAGLRAERETARREEERRLLYVAMTRAEDRLIICGAEGRGAGGADTWHALVRRGLERAGAEPCPTPAREDETGLRLGAAPAPVARCAAEDGAAAVAPPGWAARP